MAQKAKKINQIERVLRTDVKQFEKMTRAELAHEVSILASAANKRLRRLEKQGLKSPAYMYTMKHGGNFSVKGKTKEELLNEMKRAKGFLSAKTSSVKGAKKSISEMNKILAKMEHENKKREAMRSGKTFVEEIDETGEVVMEPYEMTADEIDQFWKAVDQLREMNPATFNSQCLLYVGKIENYIERGRTGKQAASYVNKLLKKAEQEAMQEQSAIEEEIQRYIRMGDNSLGANNL